MSRMPKSLPLVTLLLTACATVPTGPAVLVLPGTGKNFDQFRADDFECRQFALAQLGGQTPGRAASASGIGSAAVGTAIGAAAGAAIGGGQGAAIGAGTGLLGGSLAGAGAAGGAATDIQERYDRAYIQCMYAKGNRVPVSGRFMYEDHRESSVAPPSSSRTPLPPPPADLR